MDLFKRYENNPILKPTQNKWEMRAVFNAGAIKIGDKIALVYRARGEDMKSRLGLAWSNDGYNFVRQEEPILDLEGEFETKGAEDPRITFLDGMYNIIYIAASHYPMPHPFPKWSPDAPWRVRLSLLKTKDFVSFERKGVILNDVDSKDPAIFPEKLEEKLLMLHRIYPNLVLSRSNDWKNWTDPEIILRPRKGMWDSERVGANGPPIRVGEGWLLTYHGVNENYVYRIGAVLLDVENPTKVLARSKEPFLIPETDYERGGNECGGRVSDVVFSCGMIQNGDELIIYYGGADKYLNAGTINIKQLISSLEPVTAMEPV